VKQRVCIFILFLLGVNLYADMNTSLALIYQDKILHYLDEQKTSEAEELLEQALQYDLQLSGLWYAKTIIHNRKLEYGKALESARIAYSLKEWEGTPINKFLTLYSQLLDRMHLYEECKQLYLDLQWDSAADPVLLLRYAESLQQTGDLEGAVIAAEKGLSLFSDDPRFFQLLLSIDSQKYLYIFEDLWSQNPDIVSRIIEPLLWEKQDAGLLNFFVKYGAEDWKKEFWERTFWDVEGLSDYLSENEYIRDMKYLESIYHRGDEKVQNLIMDFMKQSRERFNWDRNKDGYTDAFLAFQNDSWLFQFDSNQDGVSEGTVRFSSSFLPQEYSRELEHGRVDVDYHWPFVREITWNRGSHKLVYTLQRGSLKSLIPPLYSKDLLAYCDVIAQLEWNMNEYELLQRSQNVSEYTDQSILFRKYFLQNGRIFMVREDSDLNGIPDRLLKTDNWQPLAALRDINEDGIFDLYEYFHEGQWEGIFLDSNQDQRGDYLESWRPGEISIWDFNQDGFMDSGFNKQRNRAIIIDDEREKISLDDTLFWDLDFRNFWFQ